MWMQRPREPFRRLTRAFTLVEVLVAIGVIALLIGILVPALGKARDRSRELASAVNLRSIGQLFEMYLGASAGMYPARARKAVPSFTPDILITVGHWQAENMFSRTEQPSFSNPITCMWPSSAVFTATWVPPLGFYYASRSARCATDRSSA
jgi:prepilin-type N-terminal cleavage/methylation domain-containing protein